MLIRKVLQVSVAAALVLVCGRLMLAVGAEPAAQIPAPAVDNARQKGPMQTAVLAGGCFWGMQGVFEHVRGVRSVLAGYSGGARSTAQYQDVGTGKTGHAESIKVIFDPAEVSYGQLLQIYFSVAHDPTQLNHQGPDSGSQYRSVIFYDDDSQRHIAESYIAQLGQDKSFPTPIVTQLDPLKGFYTAEDYHQDFYLKNPRYPYIVINDLPKIRNLKELYPDRYRDFPVTVSSH